MGLFDVFLAAVAPGLLVSGKAATAVAEEGAKKIDEWTGAKAARDEEAAILKEQERRAQEKDDRDKKQLQDLEDEKAREKNRLQQVGLRDAQRKRAKALAQSRPSTLLTKGTSLGGTDSAYGGKSLLGM